MACFLGHKYENGFCKKCGVRERGFYIPGELKPNSIAALDLYRNIKTQENKLASIPTAESMIPASVPAKSVAEFYERFTLAGAAKDGLYYDINKLMLEMYITAGDEIRINEKGITFYDGRNSYTTSYTFNEKDGTLIVSFPDQTSWTIVLNKDGGISYTADSVTHHYNILRFA